MTASEITVIISSVTTAILAVMAPIMGYMLKKLDTRATDAKLAAEQSTAGTKTQLEQIHGLVNGSLTEAHNSNSSLLKENQNQKELITRLTAPVARRESVEVITQKLEVLHTEILRLQSLLPNNPK